MNKLLETTQKFPQTEIWNDSCSCTELTYAIENGASGATTNPVIVCNVVKNEFSDWDEFIKNLIEKYPSATEEEIAWKLIQAMGEKAGQLLYPQFIASKGKRGRISYQTNAKFYRSSVKMIEHGIQLASTIKNSQIKAPTSKAGIEAFEELTYLGISINATVSFTCAQAIAVAEAVERGLNRRLQEGLAIDEMHPVCTIMCGRVDDYLKSVVKNTHLDIDSNALEYAGVAVFKNAYHLYKERGYRTKLLVAAFRNDDHFSEFIGGDLILTIPYEWQKKYGESEIEIINRISDPINEDVLNELMKLDEFVKAYEETGLSIEQFEHYGAFCVTMNQFLNGYDELLQVIRKFMVI